MTEEGGMRKRGGGASGMTSSMYKGESTMDDEEDKPLVGGAPLPDEPAGRSEDPPPRAPAHSGALAKTQLRVGMVIEKLREMDMDDVYRYWSVLQNWLADVPSKLGTSCPPLAGLGSKKELTQEQLEMLDRWCEDNVGVTCSLDDHGDLLRQLWGLSFPSTDVQPEVPDPQWKRLGFQGNDPFTDFRSAGRLSLDVLIHFAETYPAKYKETMKRSMGNGSVETSYPFACAAINVVFMLTDIMKLKRPGSGEARSNEPDAVLMCATYVALLSCCRVLYSQTCARDHVTTCRALAALCCV